MQRRIDSKFQPHQSSSDWHQAEALSINPNQVRQTCRTVGAGSRCELRKRCVVCGVGALPTILPPNSFSVPNFASSVSEHLSVQCASLSRFNFPLQSIRPSLVAARRFDNSGADVESASRCCGPTSVHATIPPPPPDQLHHCHLCSDNLQWLPLLVVANRHGKLCEPRDRRTTMLGTSLAAT